MATPTTKPVIFREWRHWCRQEERDAESWAKDVNGVSARDAGVYAAGVVAGMRTSLSTLRLHGHVRVIYH